MRQDLLTKHVIDRRTGGTVVYKMERGIAGDLIFILSQGTFNGKDIITIKLRHKGGVDVIVDRVPAFLLSQIDDMLRGRPNYGTASTSAEFGEELTQHTIVNAGEYYQVNAFKVSLGHISLGDANSELEITVDLCKAFGELCTLKIANIEPVAGPDFLLQYDKTNDLESTHNLVRGVYLYNNQFKTFFNIDYQKAGIVQGKDINLMIYTDGGAGAYETDIELMGANTSIDRQFTHSVSNVVEAYRDDDALPTPSLRLKVTGEDVKEVALLIIKEKMIQAMTSLSTIDQLTRHMAKTEQIEKMDSSLAKAYRHAGLTKHSHDYAQLKAEVVAKTPEAY
jgi:hypothetical protein